MCRPILLDNPPPRPKPSRFMPSGRWSRLLESRYLAVGGLAAGGAVAVVGASIALAMLMSYAATPNAPSRVEASIVGAAMAGPAVVKPATAEKSASSNGVQYVGEVKQADRPCEQQTWPYIAAQCLKPASGPAPVVAKVAVDRSELKASRAAAPEQKMAEHVVPAQPVAQPVAHLAVSEAAPVPVARPARQQAARDVAQPKPSRSAARPEARDARAEVRGAHASVIRPQSFHQAAAFSDER